MNPHRTDFEISGASQKGSLLIVSLWLLVLFSVMAIGLSYRQGLEARIMRHEMDSLHASWKVLAVVNLERYLIEEDPESTVDYPAKRLFNPKEVLENVKWLEPVDFTITDEESKINVNQASPELLKKLFEVLKEKEGLNGNVKEMTEAILTWRGSTTGTRADEAENKEVKGKPLESVAELLLIKKMSPHDYAILKKYVTVYNTVGGAFNTRININTASEMILKVVIDSLPADERDKETLFNEIVTYRTRKVDVEQGERTFFEESDLDPYSFATLLNLPKTITLVGLLTQLRPLLTTDSQFFTISVQLLIGKSNYRRWQVTVGPPPAGTSSVPQAAMPWGAEFNIWGGIETPSAVQGGGNLEILAWYED